LNTKAWNSNKRWNKLGIHTKKKKDQTSLEIQKKKKIGNSLEVWVLGDFKGT
jgi:hypothetical protein